jgi:endonuclease YncB( thermonuclease family)
MLGYNSAEIKTKDLTEKAKGVESRDILAGKILNKIVHLDIGDFDKYGRPLVTVTLDGENINEWMMASGHGKPYSGAGDKNW